MFNVVLGNGTMFDASAVEQTYGPVYVNGKEVRRFSLRIEVTPAENDFAWFVEQLESEDALKHIYVERDNTKVIDVTDYNHILNVTQNVLSNGAKRVVIVLDKGSIVPSDAE